MTRKLKASRTSGDVSSSNLANEYARTIAARHVPARLDARLLGGVAPALALSATLISGVAQAATIEVDENPAGTGMVASNSADGFCSLIEAIQAANANATVNECVGDTAGADTIDLPDNATFTIVDSSFVESGQPFDSDGPTGLPSVVTAITIQGDGATLQRDSAAVAFRLMHVASSGNLTLNNLTLRNGLLPNGGGQGGGGVFNRGALTVTNSTLSGNAASSSTVEDLAPGGSGGGIFNYNGTVAIANSTLSGNAAGSSAKYGGGSGGGIYNSSSGTLSIANSTLSGNAAGNGGTRFSSGYSGGDGGGVFSSGSVTITNSTISGNSTGSGGDGKYVVEGPGGSGGSGGHGGGIASSGPMTITNSTLSGNSTGSGGDGAPGGSGYSGYPNGSSGGDGGSGGSGGGVFGNGASLIIANSTVTGNATGAGGGGGNGGAPYAGGEGGSDGTSGSQGSGGGIASRGGITLSHSIIANQLSGGDCDGTNTTSLGFNLDSTSNCSLVAGGDIPGTENANLAPLANNGGPTQTHALCTGVEEPHTACAAASVAINAGGETCGVTTDQRGGARPAGGDCDIGAFESDATFGGGTFDFGDAPDTFGTTLAASGPVHTLGVAGAPFLGGLGGAPDAEADGQPNATATGDDAAGDDENGITGSSFAAGSTVTITATSTAAFNGHAWIDLNGNNTFEDSAAPGGDQVFSGPVASGGNYSFTIPAATPAGTYTVRLRVCSSTATCDTPLGAAADGEVEDYRITVTTGGGGGGGGGGGSGVIGGGGGGGDDGDGGGGGGSALDFWTLLLLGIPGLRALRRRKN